MTAHPPPGWPKQVPSPETPEWQQRATSWLLDQSAAEYRSYPLLRKYPVVLVWLVEQNLEAELQAARRAYATARAELGDALSAQVIAEVLTTLETDGARLLAAKREVGLVAAALRGEAYVPRL